jgi:hypothetical protein
MTAPISIIAAISRIIAVNPEFHRDEKMAELVRNEFSCEKRAMGYFQLWDRSSNNPIDKQNQMSRIYRK